MMDTDKVIRFLHTWVVIVLGVGLGGGIVMFVMLMQFAPSVAANLPDPIYDFFYYITDGTGYGEQ
jgi:hypothetical protein